MAELSVRELLEESAFAQAIPEKAIGELAKIAQVQAFPAHTLLFREGDEHRWIYLICRGDVVLDMHVPRRGDVRILSLGSGDLLGWSPIVGDNVMTARATTQSPTTAITIPADELRRLCRADHEIGYHMMEQVAGAMSRRLLATRLQLLDLFAETTPDASVQEG